jgi:hypothetical protein
MTSIELGVTIGVRDLNYLTPRAAAMSPSMICEGDLYANLLSDNSLLFCKDPPKTAGQRSHLPLSKHRGRAETCKLGAEGGTLQMSAEEMDDECPLIGDLQTCLPDPWVSSEEDHIPLMA